jgi:MFS family permease
MSNNLLYPKFRWFVLLTLAIVTASSSIALISPAPLMGIISHDLGLSLGETTGAMMGSFTLCVALSCIIGGIVIDRFGASRTFIGSLVLIITGELLTPIIGDNSGAMIFIRIMEGCGAGPIMAAFSTLAAEWFPMEERGIVTGVAGMSVGLGVAIGFVVSPVFYNLTGNWQSAMGWLSLFCFIGLALTIIMLLGPKAPEGKETVSNETTDNYDYKRSMGLIVTWVCVACIFFNSWLNQAFNDLTPGYLAIDPPVGLGMGPMTAGQYMMIYQIAFMIGSILAGIAVEKIFKGNARPCILIGFILIAIFASTIKLSSVYSNSTTLLLCLILTGLFMATINPVVLAFIAKEYPKQITGKIGGMVQGLGIFGGTAGVAAGSVALHGTGTYQMSISIVSVIAIVGFLVAIMLKSPKNFDLKTDTAKCITR